METMARKLVFDASTALRSRSVSTAPVRTPAGPRRNLHEQCSASTASITRCTRRTPKPSSAPTSMTRWPPSSMHSPLQGRQRHHHDPRPGLAVHPPRRYLERAYATATLLEVYQPISSNSRSAITPLQYLDSSACCAVARPLKPTASLTAIFLPTAS